MQNVRKCLLLIADSMKETTWSEWEDDNFVLALIVSGCAAIPRFRRDSSPRLLILYFSSVLAVLGNSCLSISINLSGELKVIVPTSFDWVLVSCSKSSDILLFDVVGEPTVVINFSVAALPSPWGSTSITATFLAELCNFASYSK